MNKTSMSYKLGIVLVGAMTLIVLPARVHASPPQYAVTVLDDLGGSNSYGSGVNASGQVTGRSGGAAVRWTGTTPTSLDSSYGSGINASGQVAGSYDPGGSGKRAVRWTGTTATNLGNLGGFGNSAGSLGRAINNSGTVTGLSWTTGSIFGPYHAVRWTGTTPTDLGTLGGTYSQGLGINASGQVAGWSTLVGDYFQHAVRWTDTTPTDLGIVGTYSEGIGINDSGQVAGMSYLTGATGAYHAVRWTGTTGEDLGTLGGTSSRGFGINASGDVTGMSDITGNATEAAFIYTGGTMYDLSSLLLPGSGITGLAVDIGNNINDLGQIAAFGTIGGHTHALLLTPTPEPSSATLVIGSGWMLLVRRRRGSAR